MRNQIAAAAFVLLSLLAVASMKNPITAVPRDVILANGGCPVPSLPSISK